MSLSRLALRLAAIEALNPHATAGAGPWPTLAGRFVYDSRIDPIASAMTVDAFSAAIESLESKPVITVYTEDHETNPVEGSTYPAEVEVVDLVVQLQIGAQGEIEFTDKDGMAQTLGASTIAASDGDAEAILDTLEGQARRLLDPESFDACGGLFRSVAMERHSLHSVPERASGRATRLAMRTLRMKLKIKKTTWPYAPASPPLTGYDLLPEPVRTVAKALAPTAAGRRLLALADSLAQPAALTTLANVHVAANLDRGVSPTSDGAADVVSNVTL